MSNASNTDPKTDTVFKWKINQLEVISNVKDLVNVVKAVNYTYTGTYENYTATIDGIVHLDAPESSNYKPYEQLSHDDVVSWIYTKYDIGVFNKDIIERIQLQINPPALKTIFTVPWTTDASGNSITTDISRNSPTTDASGNSPTTDASGNSTTTDASGNSTTTDA